MLHVPYVVAAKRHCASGLSLTNLHCSASIAIFLRFCHLLQSELRWQATRSATSGRSSSSNQIAGCAVDRQQAVKLVAAVFLQAMPPDIFPAALFEARGLDLIFAAQFQICS